MTHRERFFAAVAGKPVDHPPFFPDITDWYAGARTLPGRPRASGSGCFIADDDPINRSPGPMPPCYADWTLMDFYRRFDWGLPVHVYDWFETVYNGVEQSTSRQGNRRITRLRCPAGELRKVATMAADGSWAPTEHYVKRLDDLDIIRYVVERTSFRPRYERVREVLAAVGDMGVIDLPIMRSPFGKLVHEYMGFEQVVYALFDEPQRLLDFMAAQEVRDLELVALAAEAPAKVVILSDHADENLISPDLYRRYCIPHYHKACAVLHRAGKIVSTHLDGNIHGYMPLLGETGFDLLDGCTPAPMMNYEPEELAAALPDRMSCYCGVPATLLCRSATGEQVVAFGRRILEAFGGRVILNVGDILPPDGDIRHVVALGEMVNANVTNADECHE